jgi:hypothetical protein
MTTKLVREQTTAYAFKSQRLSVPVPYSALGAALISLALLALAVYVGWQGVREGSLTPPVTIATPAAPTNIAPAGPRRQYAPMPPTAEASGKAEVLRLCEASRAYYQTRSDYVCTGSCADGTARCTAR